VANYFSDAKQVLVGGVNSPVRAFKGVGGDPVFFKSAKGAYLYDIKGKKYIDYVNSWGANLLGHADSRITKAVKEQVDLGLSFGAPCELETKCARLLLSLITPSMDKVRFVNSGTEAVMSAIRLARGHTKKDKIIKFIGNYHGHADSLLVEAGSGALTLGVPSSPGVPEDIAKHTISADYNDLDGLDLIFEKYKDQIAAVIIEPIAGNMNFVMAKSNFLHHIRRLCDRDKALLIFDEVMTGFRVAPGGAQSIHNVTPDLMTFAKVIGGGMPVGALCGPSYIMNNLAPVGDVYQAGTLSGNPVAMSAGIAVLSAIAADELLYMRLNSKSEKLVNGITELAQKYSAPLWGDYLGGMFGLYFIDKSANNIDEITNFSQVMQSDKAYFQKFFHFMLDNGVYFAPSLFEAGFVSDAHTDEDIDHTLNLVEDFFKSNF
jgi:glutamate-1-semialdehyde 2,1-aminomutase